MKIQKNSQETEYKETINIKTQIEVTDCYD